MQEERERKEIYVVVVVVVVVICYIALEAVKAFMVKVFMEVVNTTAVMALVTTGQVISTSC